VQEIYREFRERAAIFLIYVAEAHPDDEWQLDSNREAGVVFNQPKSFAERVSVARKMLEALELEMPTLVDGMNDEASNAFAAWPERLFVADSEGKIAYAGGAGPFGFDPPAAREALQALVDKERASEKVP
jgi:hypothetical protein